MRTWDELPSCLAGLLAGTVIAGMAIAVAAVALSVLSTGSFLFEATVGTSGREAVTPYFGAVALAVVVTPILVGLELVGWWWARRRGWIAA